MKTYPILFLHLAGCGVAALLAGCAGTDRFAEVDTNGDGSSSRDEFSTYMKREVFEIADRDGDGRVTEEEWKGFNPESERREFLRADSNGDGGITRAEGDAAFDREGSLERLFDRIDTDRSGTLSREELAAFRSKVKQQPGDSPGQKISSAAQS